MADFLPVRLGRGFEPLWEPFAEVTVFVIDSSLGRWGSATTVSYSGVRYSGC
jgi:hypothetical protein